MFSIMSSPKFCRLVKDCKVQRRNTSTVFCEGKVYTSAKSINQVNLQADLG